ncbi:sensor histidine kinase [Parasegetibacter sp. NRK P23]|uniref:sensor histidine kinase n=1 Tax=Parasegetibacter sp. NRK P23 TaxID=2942999 RepID=UPI0020442F53|nr:histidine kinase [Parasegetibacter sp. NRK P23]MCM5528351.1 histidine kinase [Parasegetibacter sp. NRK P23]
MKRIFCFLLLINMFCHAAEAQVYTAKKQSIHFRVANVHLTITNAFITVPGKLYSPKNISYPAISEKMEVYDEQTAVSLLFTDSTVARTFAGSVFVDSALSGKKIFSPDAISVRVLFNGKVYQDWTPVSRLPSFADPETFSVQDSSKKGKSFRLPTPLLKDGQQIELEFREKNSKPFLKTRLTKLPWDTQPFLMAYKTDSMNGDNLLTLRQQLENIHHLYSETAYFGWPGSGMKGVHTVPADTKLTLYFRKRSDAGLWPFEYKINKEKTWRKSKEIIALGPMEAGSNYTLSVRFPGNDSSISQYYFSVKPPWYGTWWFRSLLLLLFAATALLVLFRLRYLRAKRKIKHYQLESKLLYAQLNPHFLFNALGSIQGLINDRQIEKANHYLTGFSGLLRGTIRMGTEEMIPLATEIKTLDHYIQLEKLRHEFQYESTINLEVAHEDIAIPPLLIQPAVENAIKHGVSILGDKGRLSISIQQEQKGLVISISDNGTGFDPNISAAGEGLKLTRARIELFNRSHPSQKIQMRITSGETGTMVIFRFQNRL